MLPHILMMPQKKGKLIRERIDRQFCIDSDGLHVVKIQWENAE